MQVDQAEAPVAQAPAARFQAATVWGPWTAVLVAVLITVIAIAGSTALLKFGFIAGPDAARGDGIGLEVLLVWQVLVILLTLLVGLRGANLRAALHLGPPVGGSRAYVSAIAIAVAFQVVITSLEFLLMPEDMLRDLKPFIGISRGALWWLAFIVVGLGAPLSEELLFRGFLLPALSKSRLGFVGAAVVSSGLWTGLHIGYTVVGLVEVFCVGLLFSWLLWRTGSLRVTILCHALYNSLIILGLRYLPLPAGLG
jgi:membrane protease YdiL (CAAX protease family)